MTAEQLKNSILQMAVSGKLVPQGPNDEPASVLLERIRKEKEQLIKEGKIKKEKNPSYIFRGADNTPYEKVGNNDPVSIADEVPFEIPESWEWARASSLGKMIRGKGIKRTETVDHGLPCVRYGEIYTSYNIVFSETKSFISPSLDKACLHFSSGDIIFTLTGENNVDIAKAVAYCGDIPVAAGGDMAFWTAHGMNPLYLVYYMASPYCIEQKRRTATGDIIVHISTDKVGGFMVPVPPIEEQDRIVKKLQTIEHHLEKYKESESTLEALNKSFPEQLKKSILQMAVQGKLVEQDPNDEPASILLERIHAEKERLIAEGKIKRDKNESVIYRRDNSHYEKFGSKEYCIDDELPFEIPDSWMWSKLNMCLDVRDGTHDTPRYVSEGVPLVTSKNLVDGKIDFSTAKNISYADHKEISIRSEVNSGDILFAMIGSIGNPVLYLGEDEFSIKNMALFKHINCGMNMKYVYWYLYLEQYQMRRYSSGGVQAFVSLKYLRNYWIPIPPLEEQERIVSAIENLVEMTCQL